MDSLEFRGPKTEIYFSAPCFTDHTTTTVDHETVVYLSPQSSFPCPFLDSDNGGRFKVPVVSLVKEPLGFNPVLRNAATVARKMEKKTCIHLPTSVQKIVVKTFACVLSEAANKGSRMRKGKKNGACERATRCGGSRCREWHVR